MATLPTDGTQSVCADGRRGLPLVLDNDLPGNRGSAVGGKLAHYLKVSDASVF